MVLDEDQYLLVWAGFPTIARKRDAKKICFIIGAILELLYAQKDGSQRGVNSINGGGTILSPVPTPSNTFFKQSWSRPWKIYTAANWIASFLSILQVIHSEEDRMWMKGPNVILCHTGGGHEDVDRIRSAHRHDLETLLPYLLIMPIWLYTSPSFPLARTILPCFAIVSILYTLLHMQIVNAHRYCKTILSALEFCTLISVSAMSVHYYANALRTS